VQDGVPACPACASTAGTGGGLGQGGTVQANVTYCCLLVKSYIPESDHLGDHFIHSCFRSVDFQPLQLCLFAKTQEQFLSLFIIINDFHVCIPILMDIFSPALIPLKDDPPLDVGLVDLENAHLAVYPCETLID
jgi:hypothetical protein